MDDRRRRQQHLLDEANAVGRASEIDALEALTISLVGRAFLMCGGDPVRTADLLLEYCDRALNATIKSCDRMPYHRAPAALQ